VPDVPLRCRCGTSIGVAHVGSSADGFRFVCYCEDCRAFARFLKRPDVLDAAGGTDIYQMPPGRVKLETGLEPLRCVRFSPKVLRWYVDCCQTPIANTAATPGFPIVGMIHACMPDAGTRSRDEVLGAALCRIYDHSARGRLAPDAPPQPSVGTFIRRSWKMLRWQALGLHHPNPFFDEQGVPRAEPRILPRSAALAS
jgi:Family of unknown function (DUF6151)